VEPPGFLGGCKWIAGLAIVKCLGSVGSGAEVVQAVLSTTSIEGRRLAKDWTVDLNGRGAIAVDFAAPMNDDELLLDTQRERRIVADDDVVV
jgi:hypothetical protein